MLKKSPGIEYSEYSKYSIASLPLPLPRPSPGPGPGPGPLGSLKPSFCLYSSGKDGRKIEMPFGRRDVAAYCPVGLLAIYGPFKVYEVCALLTAARNPLSMILVI